MTKFCNSSIINILLIVENKVAEYFSNSDLKEILKEVNSIAIIGASSKKERDSYKVMKFLIEKGYKVFPVNPNEAKKNILGKKCYSSIKEVSEKIDMLDIFRSKEFIMDITKEAIEIGINIIWTQEGLIDEKSFRIAKNAGVIFVMNECPKKILEN